MNNNELDDLLKKKFASLQDPGSNASLVPEVMLRIADLAPADLAPPGEIESAQKRLTSGDWLVIVAASIGALIFLSSLQVLPVDSLSVVLPLELLGGYAQTASTLLLPLAGFAAFMPVAWLMLED